MTVNEIILIIASLVSFVVAGLYRYKWRLALRELNDADRLYADRLFEERQERRRLEQGHADWRLIYIEEVKQHVRTAAKLAELENERNLQ